MYSIAPSPLVEMKLVVLPVSFISPKIVRANLLFLYPGNKKLGCSFGPACLSVELENTQEHEGRIHKSATDEFHTLSTSLQ